jgi:curli biogenesis system outer membrane secretion channel CsgG
MRQKIYSISLSFLIGFFILQPVLAQENDDDNVIIPIPEYTPTGNEPKVTVIDFTNESFFESDVLGRAATTMFQSALVESKRFILIDRTMLAAKIDEMKYSYDQLTNEELLEVCRGLGVRYIISGSVTEFAIKKTGTTVKTKITDSNYGVGGGLTMEKGKGTARVAIDIKFTDVPSKEVPLSTSTVGIATSKNSIFGLELLLPISGLKTGVEIGQGVEGFDNTLAGRGIRNASRQLINNIIQSNLYKW